MKVRQEKHKNWQERFTSYQYKLKKIYIEFNKLFRPLQIFFSEAVFEDHFPEQSFLHLQASPP